MRRSGIASPRNGIAMRHNAAASGHGGIVSRENGVPGRLRPTAGCLPLFRRILWDFRGNHIQQGEF